MTLLPSNIAFSQTVRLKPGSVFLLLLVVLTGNAQQIPVSTTSKIAKAHYERGIYLSCQHLDGKAAEAFRQAVNADSSFALARLNFGMHAYALKSQSVDEVKEITKALAVAGGITPAEQKFIQAEKSLRLGNHTEARHLLEELVKDYPDDVQARQELGYLYYFQFNDFVRAEETWKEGFRRHPRISRFINNLGYALKAQGKRKEAEVAFKEAIEKFPSEANTYDSLGDLYLDMQRFDEAINQYQIAVSFNEPDVDSKENLMSAATGKTSLLFGNLSGLNDSTTIANMFTSSTLLLSPERKSFKGLTAVKQYLQAEITKGVTSWKIKPEETRFAENWSWEMGKYTKTGKAINKAADGNYNIIWVYTSSGWKIERLMLY